MQPVDFKNYSYPSPCTNQAEKSVRVHDGTYEYQYDRLSATVQTIYRGTMSKGTGVAIVAIACEVPIGGFDAVAHAYAIDGDRAIRLTDVGTCTYAAGDDPYPKGGWIHATFKGGLLYVDVWDGTNDVTAWTVTTYALREGQLQRVYRERHHRKR